MFDIYICCLKFKLLAGRTFYKLNRCQSRSQRVQT